MMKKFLYRLLLFSLPLLLTLTVLEIYISNQRMSMFSEKKLARVFAASGRGYQWVDQVRHPRKVLLLGSSSVKYGLSCGQLNRLSKDSFAFINLAADARDPIETWFILQQLDLSDVKAMYMGIDPWIFTRNYYRNRNQYLLLDLSFTQALRYSKEYDLRLFARRYKGLAGMKDPGPAVQKSIPHDFGSVALTRQPVNFNDPVTKKFRLKAYGWSEWQFLYLQKIAMLCESKGISFTAFYPPRRPDWLNDYQQNGRSIQASFLEQLDQSGFKTPIRRDWMDSFPRHDSFFADAYHLNARGMNRFGELFFPSR